MSLLRKTSSAARPTTRRLKVECKNESKDCTAKVVVTSYSKRDTLDDKGVEIEKTYNEIAASADLTKLCAALTDAAKKLKVDPSTLAVSDLFDMSCDGCDNHDSHGTFTIKLKSEVLKNFVGLLHYHNGSWELVDGASAEDGELTFKVDDFSPFAIVVSTENTTQPAANLTWLYIVLACVVVVAVVAIVVVVLKKKNTKKA